MFQVSEMMCAARDTCFTFEVIDTALKNMGIRIRKWRQNIIFGLHDWCMNFEEQCQALSCEEMGVSHPTMSPIATGRRK